MKDKSGNLVDFLDTVFIVKGEMIKDNGEDSYAFSLNKRYGIVGVFDGCGGIGSRKYEDYGSKTGAYMASHSLAAVFVDWFNKRCEENADLSIDNLANVCKDLTVNFNTQLKSLESNTTTSVIKGSLTKSFPTTASVIIFENKGNTLCASYIWAGDSRGYVLTKHGLAQVTKDDIDDDEDAFSNLSSDGRLTNVISAVGDYKLNGIGAVCKNAAILITATDGCFGYFATPMEFEYMLLDTMDKADSVTEWRANLKKYILEYTGDDYTLGVVAFGYENYKSLKKAYAERKKHLYETYISVLKDATPQQKNDLWKQYKKDYYRGE